jgi:hypothetical protein
MDTWHERWYEELDRDNNRYLALPGRATLGQAFALLRSPEIDGAIYWHLIVDRSDGTWAFAQFRELYEQVQAAGEEALDTPLDELEWLREVRETQVVDLSRMGVSQAVRKAQAAPGRLCLVMDDQELAGVLYEGTHRKGELAFSTSALTELAGRYADLSEFSDLLIKPRRPKPAQETDEDKEEEQERGD